jgi:hypothetical protein
MKIKEKLKIKFAPFDKQEMIDFQTKYKDTMEKKKEIRK